MKGRTNGHLLYCEVVHKIRGRVRIKSKALKYLGKLKNEVEKQLEQVRYIESAKISSVTGTVVIYFDDINVTDDNLIALIQNTLNVYLVEIYKNERAENSKNFTCSRLQITVTVQKLLLPGELIKQNSPRACGDRAVTDDIPVYTRRKKICQKADLARMAVSTFLRRL